MRLPDPPNPSTSPLAPELDAIRDAIRSDAREWLAAYPEERGILESLIEYAGDDLVLLARLRDDWRGKSPPETEVAVPVEYVSVKTAAVHYGVSEGTIRNWLRAGKLSAVQPNGKRGKYRIPRSELS